MKSTQTALAAIKEVEEDLPRYLRKAQSKPVVITRRGRPIAKLVPIDATRDPEKARAAGRRIRELAKEMNLGPFDWEEWKRYRDEGRP